MQAKATLELPLPLLLPLLLQRRLCSAWARQSSSARTTCPPWTRRSDSSRGDRWAVSGELCKHNSRHHRHRVGPGQIRDSGTGPDTTVTRATQRHAMHNRNTTANHTQRRFPHSTNRTPTSGEGVRRKLRGFAGSHSGIKPRAAGCPSPSALVRALLWSLGTRRGTYRGSRVNSPPLFPDAAAQHSLSLAAQSRWAGGRAWTGE